MANNFLNPAFGKRLGGQGLRGAPPAYPFPEHYDLPNQNGQVHPDPARPYTPGMVGGKAIGRLLPYTGAHVYPRAGWDNIMGSGVVPSLADSRRSLDERIRGLAEHDPDPNGQRAYDSLVTELGGYGGGQQSQGRNTESGNFLSPAFGQQAIYKGPFPANPMQEAKPIGTYRGGAAQPTPYQNMLAPQQRQPAPPMGAMGGPAQVFPGNRSPTPYLDMERSGAPRPQASQNMLAPQQGGATPHFGLSEDDKDLLRQKYTQNLTTQFTAPYERDPNISGDANFRAKNILENRNFNHAYNQNTRQAMDVGRPGMGLMTDMQAAQLGDYKNMPNVTVGGAYGQGPVQPDNSYLNARLGLDGKGGTVPGGETDPTTLGALRSRMPAPWMNQPAAPANNFDTSGSMASTLAARKARVDASGGRMIMLPDGRVTVNPSAGIPAAAQAQPSTEYTARQVENEALKAQRQALVQQNSMARSDARRGRIAARNQGPTMADMLMQNGDTQGALGLMQLQQQGMLGQQHLNQQGAFQQGQLQNDANKNILAQAGQNNQFALGMQELKNQAQESAQRAQQFAEQNGIRSKELDAAAQRDKQQFDLTYQQGERQGKEANNRFDATMQAQKSERAMQYRTAAAQAAQSGDSEGAAKFNALADQLEPLPGNVMGGMPGAPGKSGGKQLSMPQEASLASYKTREEKIRYLKSLKWTDQQINARLAEGNERGMVGDILGAAGVDYAPPSVAGPGGQSLRPFSPASVALGPFGLAHNIGSALGWLTGAGRTAPVTPTVNPDGTPAEGWERDPVTGRMRQKQRPQNVLSGGDNWTPSGSY